MIIDEDNYLAHYGILRRSGRYPWGSGGNQSTRNAMFLDEVERLRKEGLSQTQIARGFGISTTELRAYKTYAINEQRNSRITQAKRLKDKGMSNSAIGRQMGVNESVVRSLLKQQAQDKAAVLDNTAQRLKDEFKKSPYLDVGTGVENHMGISREKLSAAVKQLEDEGYVLMRPKVQQLGTGKDTQRKILTPPGTEFKDFIKDVDRTGIPGVWSDDGGHTFHAPKPPKSVSMKRVQVIAGDEGGAEADGVIYVRPGTKDLSLGNAHYAQVRILVNGTHYLKGMAIYKDDLPEGVDLQFNTNKPRKDLSKEIDALKEISKDPQNPFGAITRQVPMNPDRPDGAYSAANLVNEAGRWDEWSRNLSTQMLSKQDPSLARQQLNLTYENRQDEFEQIKALTNPAVKRKMLQEFAEGTDAAAVHMKAAALPRQATRVILPISKLKETEIYAPGFDNGEEVALIRYPHGGTFEIPVLRVNNKESSARSLLGDAKDAVGINAAVAERLSGADFDGDTVLVIPNSDGRIRSTPALDGLRNFDPRTQYKQYPGMKVISAGHMQKQMGDVSNLITDMTLRKASPSEMARAVRHSMVVIDSHKHKLDYKQSEKDNGITQLKEKYQSGPKSGATTLISKARSDARVDERILRRASEGGPIDPRTGALVYTPTGRTYTDKNGATVKRQSRVEKLALTDDANTLSSGTPMERIYASHSNRLKAMANEARLEQLRTPKAVRNPSAAKTYSKEVDELKAALDLAQKNAPLERQAQQIANARVRLRRQANPEMDKDQIKKVESVELTEARAITGAKKNDIKITDQQWTAIQAGAVSDTMLNKIMDNADMDRVRELATPKTALLMNSTRLRRAQGMIDAGYTRAEVARQLGVSVSTLDKSLDA